jgi:pimeloyl-ACP methyl ester carboxylesterase
MQSSAVPSTRRVGVDGAELEVTVQGSGEPVVLIQTALLAEELAPLADQPVLAAYQLIRYHRRGYAGSSAVPESWSIKAEAEDCRRLLGALSLSRAHVVGLSFSCAIALQLATETPQLVHSLTLLEPPPLRTPSEPEFRTISATLHADYRQQGPGPAADAFLTRIIGPDWRTAAADVLPDRAEQLARDMAVFVESDMPGLLGWQFDDRDAAGIVQPVLYVGGVEREPLFAEVPALIRRWLPQTEGVLLPGAGHSLTITHPSEVATALERFLRHHSISQGRT